MPSRLLSVEDAIGQLVASLERTPADQRPDLADVLVSIAWAWGEGEVVLYPFQIPEDVLRDGD
jgi:hypothetical protein